MLKKLADLSASGIAIHEALRVKKQHKLEIL